MQNHIKLSVRNLIETTLRSGDIDNRFMSTSRALEGTLAHQKIQSNYKEKDLKEVTLSISIDYKGFVFDIDGRADGILFEDENVIYDKYQVEEFFYSLLDRYIVFAKMVEDWKKKRDLSINKIEFPFNKYRRGQRELAVGVYTAIKEGKRLFVKAPTGIGKTYTYKELCMNYIKLVVGANIL